MQISLIVLSSARFHIYFAMGLVNNKMCRTQADICPIYHLPISVFGTSKKNTFNVQYFLFSYFLAHSKISLEIQHQVGLLWWEKKNPSFVLFEVKILLQRYHLRPFSSFQHLCDLLFINSSSIKVGNFSRIRTKKTFHHPQVQIIEISTKAFKNSFHYLIEY